MKWLIMSFCNAPVVRVLAHCVEESGDFLFHYPLFRPVLTENFRLLEDKLGSTCLLVRRVAVFSKNTLDIHTHMSTDVFPDGPVDGDAVAHRLNQLLGNQPQRVVAEYFDALSLTSSAS